MVYKQAKKREQQHDDAIKIGSGLAIGVGILTGAVLIAQALGGKRK